MASHGDSEAYDTLFKEFYSRAETLATYSGLKLSKYTGISAEFHEVVEKMFFKILNEYDKDKGTFGHYAEFCLGQRLPQKIAIIVGRWNEDDSDIDLDEAERKNAETTSLEYASAEMRRNIQFRKLKLKIGSPNASVKPKQKLQRKVALMVYAGYRPIEIKQKLHLSESKYRTIIENLKKDEDIINLKLEMK